MKFDGFDWDAGNRDKCRKHGVSIAEIESMFQGVVAVAPDINHSEHEERFKAIGSNEDGRKIFVAFTVRRYGGDSVIRPVSARYMHRKEIGYYEATTSNP